MASIKPAPAVGSAVKSAERALRILEYLATSGPAQFSDVRRDLGIPKSSLHALLGTMAAIGWISSDGRNSYVIGYRARAIGIAGGETSDVIALSEDLLAALRDDLGETIHLARLDGQDVHYLSSKFSAHALNVRFDVGRRLPAYATALGKAMLAEFPDDVVARHLPPVLTPLTSKTISTKAGLLEELAVTRRTGFAEEDEQSSIGLHCFAVAIQHDDLPLIAISCSVPKARLEDLVADRVAASLVEARRQLLLRLRPVSSRA